MLSFARLPRLQRRPRIRGLDLVLTLLPGLLWAGEVQLRTWWITPHCALRPESCALSTVLPVDRPGLGIENGEADGYSYVTQNLSGALALTGPVAWNLALIPLIGLSPGTALLQTATDLIIVTQAALWNGALNESARLLVQRPRPFVYGDPIRAKDPQNYTSFYSGHTSFAAVTTTSLFLMLLSRGAPLLLLLFAGTVGEGLIFSTAVFRILAGRHFLTDVLTGAFAGAFMACVIAYFHRSRPRP